MSKKIDLVKTIRDNPGCIAVIDNDAWWLWRDDAHRDSEDGIPLACDGDVKPLGDGGYRALGLVSTRASTTNGMFRCRCHKAL